MSRKYLLLLIFMMLLCIGAVSASDNSTDNIVSVDSESDVVSLDDDSESKLADGYGYDEYEKAILKPTELSTTYNSGETFKVKAVSAYDKSITLEDVKLKIRVYTKNNYKVFYAFTDYEGIATFDVSDMVNVGTHKVQVSSADQYTKSSNVNSKIIIKKANTKVSAPKVTANYKKSKTFKITIKNKANGEVVENVKISVKVGNKKYTLKTNDYGVASFNTKNLKTGTHKVTIKSKNSNYKINAKSSIKIKKVAKKKTTKKSSKKSKSSSGGGSYVGNLNTGKFHYSSCSYVKRMSSSNKVYLSRSQAISLGYTPCKVCRP